MVAVLRSCVEAPPSKASRTNGTRVVTVASAASCSIVLQDQIKMRRTTREKGCIRVGAHEAHRLSHAVRACIREGRHG